ncbi:class I SAM-dependent methyltransferase [Kibdelosporangium aridum]|uniref:Class I SAM-dependent methyltransferase n=1 Tax=Kibdelosporangium aridum TaxID=2030 RepID=A0A428ZRJ2_KIBAR|nr:class I SAM-dependent methyltransferase [Kibdelosporangium aridum]RSM90689.1 class I SAM-dependent methyltransferase [Kibdelosporangium aridum]
MDYHHELTSGAGRFFHPKMATCPWCGGTDIVFRIRVADTRQCKPGVFTMDECVACGHVFQNPRLTDRGLAYYCHDFYDGVGREHYASVAEYTKPAHRKRVQLVGGNPANWLDVGARHGHFCREARKLLPGTKFWALDPSEEILRGQDRGWVDEAARVSLIEFAEENGEKFDVVSLIHYLERTPSPSQELAAVHKVLRKGGVALIEVVNPESRFARLHGRYWYCWLAPQNMNLMPYDNMRSLLERSGFEVTTAQRGKANKPFDNMAALMTALNHHLPPAKPWPWLSRSRVSLRERVVRKGTMLLAAPLLGLALAVDLLLHLVTARGRGGNTYRIVAVAR